VDRFARFEFRARSPLYVNHPIQFTGISESDRIELRAIGVSGMLAMEATAWLAGPSASSERLPHRSG
jgi:hydroxyacyl-ACP dehydratase HTD2-like protein with hotdog domain